MPPHCLRPLPVAVDVMLPHFQDTLNDTRFGTTMALVALRSYLDSQGVDSNKWWLSVQTSIVQVRHMLLQALAVPAP